ncbi:MAG: tRNA (adenosine(37)-N6)-threonylcarbamoyltransferase complex ATPase subunit type 1 TsaE [Candidatus Omnitrophota bacterium]
MKHFSLYSHSREETICFASRLAKLLRKNTVIGFFGNLGSGKTTFIKGLAEGLGVKGRINSPSFVILKVYPLNKRLSNARVNKHSLYHFDLYRLNSLKELEDVGYEEFISGDGICVVEWADRAKRILPKDYLKIRMQVKGRNSRLIKITSLSKKYENLINKIKKP